MRWVRRALYAAVAAGIIGALVFALMPKPIAVDLAEVVRGQFEQTIDDDGKTRVRERYTVSAPLAGTLLRVGLKAGDHVEIGSVLASIMPNPSPLLEPRTRQELEQRLGAAEARRARASAAVARARANLDQANADLDRSRQLAAKGVVPPSKLERDEILVRIFTRELEVTAFEDHAAEHEVDLAKAALEITASDLDKRATTGDAWDVHSPVAGQVFRILQKSEASVVIGTPLIEIGNSEDLEVVVDVLSTDAVQILPGASVHIERWGGDVPLEGRVRRVEPSAFTKVSALGVEEQRTNVVIDIVSPKADWGSLGDGYRVDARIVVYELDDALKVPTGALFREGDRWAVFVDDHGIARKRVISISRRTGLEAAVANGLEQGDQVILYPSDAIRDGVGITSR